ncbi:MAG: hypothetical protein ABJC50_03435, partial [Nonlabens ulvanivorans]|uniref:hypothetical protein n=2 Tax=Nonlabens TaxID=363408 RepID=UPI0032661BDE
FGAVNFDTAAGTADAGVVATTGSVVELTIEGGVYTIMYDILGGDGTTNIIGSYQGTLTSI